MKGNALLKEVVRYQWYDVLFDRFYSREYVSLEVNDLWQDVAKRITFGWGLGVGLGVGILLFLLALKLTIGLLLIPIALGLIVLAFLFSSIVSCGYLYFRIRRHDKEIAYRKRLEREGYGELHGDRPTSVEDRLTNAKHIRKPKHAVHAEHSEPPTHLKD